MNNKVKEALGIVQATLHITGDSTPLSSLKKKW